MSASLIRTVCFIASGTVMLGSASFAETARFIPLGDLPGGVFESRAMGVSPDGGTVVGWSMSRDFGPDDFAREAFVWTEATGMVGLGALSPRNESIALDVSANGHVVTGILKQGNSDNVAATWASETGWVPLESVQPGGLTSMAFALSAGGEVVVGQKEFDSSGPKAYVWTLEQGFSSLGTLAGVFDDSAATDIAADGQLVVGHSTSPSPFGQGNVTEAFRWTNAEGMVGLGFLPGGNASSARAVSADGSTIAGTSKSAAFPGLHEGFRWTPDTGMQSLGSFPTPVEVIDPRDTSGDGSIIIGSVVEDLTHILRPFIWDEAHGLRDLKAVLIEEHGLLELEDWQLGDAWAISDDGKIIVGSGVNPNGNGEGWVVRIPEPSSGLMMMVLSSLTFRRTRRIRYMRRQ